MTSSIRQLGARAGRALGRGALGAAAGLAVLEYTTELPSRGRASWLYHYVNDEYGVPLMRATLGPETAHNIALLLLQWGLAPQHRPNAAEQQITWHHNDEPLFANPDQNVPGLQASLFHNPIGLAAGFDKHGQAIQPLFQLGFGLVEIGTVTPQPQEGNPQPRMFRLVRDQAIINRYGFNSQGIAQVGQHLKEYRENEKKQEEEYHNFHHTNHPQPWWRRLWRTLYPPQIARGALGVNLGKNKLTPNANAIDDYVAGIQQLAPYADYLVINISSPNTPNLRELQQGDELAQLLDATCQARNQICDATGPRIPLLVKLAPDLTDEQLADICQTCLAEPRRCDGIILTNTTNQRPADLLSSNDVTTETGGLSGAPLGRASTRMIRQVYRHTQGQIDILGVGGISNGADAYEKFKAGASAVQIYSCLVYQGPGTVSRMRRELAELMQRNGHKDLRRDVIGRDHDDLFWNLRQRRMEERMKREPAEPVIVEDGSGMVVEDETTEEPPPGKDVATATSLNA